MDLQVPLLIIDRRRISIMSALFANRRVTHLRFEVVLSRYGICVGDRMMFGVSEWIRDITRRSGMVRRIRFIYWGSFSKLGNVPECLYGDSRRFRNVLEGSRGFLGVCLKTKKGIKETKWGTTRIRGGGGFLPPTRRPKEEGVLLGLPLPRRASLL